MHTLLLVRNGVDHDARVLRAARVAERTFAGSALVVGVDNGTGPGPCTVEGVRVQRLALGMPRAARPRAAPGDSGAHAAIGRTARLTLRARARRIAGGWSFALQSIMLARRLKPRLVHANDWNTMWSGLAIKLLCGARLVYDSHELWPDRNGRWEWRPWLLASEAIFVRAADEVITASPGYADALARRHRIPRPTVIRNIPEGTPVRLPAPQTSAVVIYVGGLMPGRGLEQAIDALALAPAVHLRAVGPGPAAYRAHLLRRAMAAGVGDRLELAPAVAPSALPATLAQASAGLCLIQPVCRSYELTLPNKLFEYAAAGLPILASDLPVIGPLVRAAGLGEVVCPTDPQAIADGMLRLTEPGAWHTASRRSQAFAQANSWPAEAQALARAYRSAGSNGAAPAPSPT